MGRFRIFLGAPTVAELRSPTPGSYTWQTTTSPGEHNSQHEGPRSADEAVSRRISALYENITIESHIDSEGPEDEDNSNILDQTTMITWPATASRDLSEDPSQDESREVISFLRSTHHASRVQSEHLTLTQDTEDTTSYDYSDASSITRFPTFHFNLNTLTSLQALTNQVRQRRPYSLKINILAAVLDIDGPDSIRLKKGIDAGKQVSILKLIVGDDAGAVCRLTAWRDVAEAWAGHHDNDQALKRGDIVHFENVLTARDPSGPGSTPTSSPVTLTASPNLRSKMTVCFRTMPDGASDARFRPDLRLGFSDAAVRKVARVVNWLEEMAGLPRT